MSTNKNPFPFYTLEGEVWTNYKPAWHRNNKNCVGTCCYEHKLYPGLHWFQHKLESSIASSTGIEAVEVRNVGDNSIVAGTTINTTLMQDQSGNKFLLISLDVDSSLIGGQYYLSIETENVNYYSEIFCVANQNNDRIGLIWKSTGKVGNMVYANSFKHQINLDARIVLAEPQLEQQVVENGFGEETPTLQKLTQAYTFSCIVPNFIAEALSALKLHRQFNVFNYYTGEAFIDEFDSEIKSIDVTVTPEDDACNSFVQVTYTKETIIETGCDETIVNVEDVVVVYKEHVQEAGGEFNTTNFSIGVIDLDDETDPFEGTKHIHFNALDSETFSGSTVMFVSSMMHGTSGRQLSLRFKQLVVQPYHIVITIYNSQTQENEQFTIQDNSFGMDPNSTAYQLVEIPLEGFGVESFDRIQIFNVHNPDGNDVDFYIDNILIDNI